MLFAAALATQGEGVRYLCTLTGAAGATSRVAVDVSGRSWRAEWAPVRG